jgi:hypothetical protein
MITSAQQDFSRHVPNLLHGFLVLYKHTTVSLQYDTNMQYHKQDINSVIYVTVHHSDFFTVGIPLCYIIKFKLKDNSLPPPPISTIFFISQIVTQQLQHKLIYVRSPTQEVYFRNIGRQQMWQWVLCTVAFCSFFVKCIWGYVFFSWFL